MTTVTKPASVRDMRSSKPIMSDPIVAIGRKLGDAIRENERLALASYKRRNEEEKGEAYFTSAATHIYDQMEDLRVSLSHEQATSLLGAAVQIGQALSGLDVMCDWLIVPEGESYRAGKEKRALDRLLYSALMAVEQAAAVTIADAVSPEFASEHCNPWVPVDERVKKLFGGPEGGAA